MKVMYPESCQIARGQFVKFTTTNGLAVRKVLGFSAGCVIVHYMSNDSYRVAIDNIMSVRW